MLELKDFVTPMKKYMTYEKSMISTGSILLACIFYGLFKTCLWKESEEILFICSMA
jgi:hypothetical protein